MKWLTEIPYGYWTNAHYLFLGVVVLIGLVTCWNVTRVRHAKKAPGAAFGITKTEVVLFLGIIIVSGLLAGVMLTGAHMSQVKSVEVIRAEMLQVEQRQRCMQQMLPVALAGVDGTTLTLLARNNAMYTAQKICGI